VAIAESAQTEHSESLAGIVITLEKTRTNRAGAEATRDCYRREEPQARRHADGEPAAVP
jgi:hypothetical protein